MKTKRILAVVLSAVMLIGTTKVYASTNNTYQPQEPLMTQASEPVLLTDTQLLELIEDSPCRIDTKSNTTFADRRITESELASWIEEYWTLGINAFELEMVRLINIERQNHNLNPLAINPTLMMAARFHSQEMVDLRFFNHRSPHHGRGIYRAEMFGHENIQDHVWGVRENIASGVRTPEQIVQAWMNSPGHRSAILGETYLTIGVGTVQNSTTAKFGS